MGIFGACYNGRRFTHGKLVQVVPRDGVFHSFGDLVFGSLIIF